MCRQRRQAELLPVTFDVSHQPKGAGAGLIEGQTRQGALRRIAAGRQRLVQQQGTVQQFAGFAVCGIRGLPNFAPKGKEA